jgi:hypothetical protein
MRQVELRSPGRCLSCALILFWLAPAVFARLSAQDPAATSTGTTQSAGAAKPKKVWTNDDVAPATGASVASSKPAAANTVKAADSNAKLAEELRNKLGKLESQLKDTEKQLNDLKNFQSGEGSGNAGRQLHKGYNMQPIPEQIQKLEGKRQQLEEQIDALYDEARRKGILPGELR